MVRKNIVFFQEFRIEQSRNTKSLMHRNHFFAQAGERSYLLWMNRGAGLRGVG